MNKAEAKIIQDFLKDKLTYVVVHKEVLNGDEIGEWAERQDIGHFIYIHMDIIDELRRTASG